MSHLRFQLGEEVLYCGLSYIITHIPRSDDPLMLYRGISKKHPILGLEVTEGRLTKVFERSTMSFQELMNSFSEA